TLTPALGALAGAGLTSLWTMYRRGRWAIILLPLALILTAAWQTHVVADYSAWGDVLTPVLVGGSVVAAALLLLAAGLKKSRQVRRLASGAVAIGLLALLLSP